MADDNIAILVDLGARVSESSFVKAAQEGSRIAQQNTKDVVFKADFSKVIQGATAGKSAFNQLTEATRDFGDSLDRGLSRITALGIASAALFGIGRAFESSLRSARELEASLKDINVILGLPGEKLKDFGNSLFDIARSTKSTFGEAAEAAKEFSRQGLGMEETLKRTQAALTLVNLAGLSAADSTKAITVAINSFSKDNLTAIEIVNKLAAVDAKFAVSSKDLAEALSRAGSSAQESGVSFDKFIGLVTGAQQITQRGGAVIANAFQTIFTRLKRKDTLDTLEQLGIQVREVEEGTGRLTGALVPADKILEQVKGKFDGLTQAEKAHYSEVIAGTRQINVLSGALAGLNVAQDAYKTSLNASDEATRRQLELLTTQDAKIKNLATSLQQVGANVGQIGFGDFINKHLEGLTKGTGGGIASNVGGELIKAFSGTGTSAAEQVGGDFAKIFVKSVSDILLGPGLVGLTLVGTKIASTIAGFVSKQFAQLNPFSDEAALQGQINTLLKSQSEEVANILSTENNKVLAEQKILNLFREQNAALAQGAEFAARTKEILNSSAGRGIVSSGGGVRTGANGIIDAIAREEHDISRGVGGASSKAKPVYLPNLNGKPAVVNTDEYIVPNYARSGTSAIFNKQMISQLGLPEDAVKITEAMSFPSKPSFKPTIRPKRAISHKFESVIDDLVGSDNPTGAEIPNPATASFREVLKHTSAPIGKLTSHFSEEELKNLLDLGHFAEGVVQTFADGLGDILGSTLYVPLQKNVYPQNKIPVQGQTKRIREKLLENGLSRGQVAEFFKNFRSQRGAAAPRNATGEQASAIMLQDESFKDKRFLNFSINPRDLIPSLQSSIGYTPNYAASNHQIFVGKFQQLFRKLPDGTIGRPTQDFLDAAYKKYRRSELPLFVNALSKEEGGITEQRFLDLIDKNEAIKNDFKAEDDFVAAYKKDPSQFIKGYTQGYVPTYATGDIQLINGGFRISGPGGRHTSVSQSAPNLQELIEEAGQDAALYAFKEAGGGKGKDGGISPIRFEQTLSKILGKEQFTLGKKDDSQDYIRQRNISNRQAYSDADVSAPSNPIIPQPVNLQNIAEGASTFIQSPANFRPQKIPVPFTSTRPRAGAYQNVANDIIYPSPKEGEIPSLEGARAVAQGPENLQKVVQSTISKSLEEFGVSVTKSSQVFKNIGNVVDEYGKLFKDGKISQEAFNKVTQHATSELETEYNRIKKASTPITQLKQTEAFEHLQSSKFLDEGQRAQLHDIGNSHIEDKRGNALLQDLLNNERANVVREAKISELTSKIESNTGAFKGFGNLAPRFERFMLQNNLQFSETTRNNIRNRAGIASFAIPFLGEAIANPLIEKIQDPGEKARASRATSSTLSGLSTAALIASIAPNPIGLGAAGLVGLGALGKGAYEATNVSDEDRATKLDAFVKEIDQQRAALQTANKSIYDFKTAITDNTYTEKQRTSALREALAATRNVNDPRLSSALREQILSRDFSEAGERKVQAVREDVDRKQRNDIALNPENIALTFNKAFEEINPTSFFGLVKESSSGLSDQTTAAQRAILEAKLSPDAAERAKQSKELGTTTDIALKSIEKLSASVINPDKFENLGLTYKGGNAGSKIIETVTNAAPELAGSAKGIEIFEKIRRGGSQAEDGLKALAAELQNNKKLLSEINKDASAVVEQEKKYQAAINETSASIKKLGEFALQNIVSGGARDIERNSRLVAQSGEIAQGKAVGQTEGELKFKEFGQTLSNLEEDRKRAQLETTNKFSTQFISGALTQNAPDFKVLKEVGGDLNKLRDEFTNFKSLDEFTDKISMLEEALKKANGGDTDLTNKLEQMKQSAKEAAASIEVANQVEKKRQEAIREQNVVNARLAPDKTQFVGGISQAIEQSSFLHGEGTGDLEEIGQAAREKLAVFDATFGKARDVGLEIPKDLQEIRDGLEQQVRENDTKLAKLNLSQSDSGAFNGAIGLKGLQRDIIDASGQQISSGNTKTAIPLPSSNNNLSTILSYTKGALSEGRVKELLSGFEDYRNADTSKRFKTALSKGESFSGGNNSDPDFIIRYLDSKLSDSELEKIVKVGKTSSSQAQNEISTVENGKKGDISPTASGKEATQLAEQLNKIFKETFSKGVNLNVAGATIPVGGQVSIKLDDSQISELSKSIFKSVMDGLGDRITKVEAKVQTHGDNIEAIKKDTGTVVPPKQPQS